MPAFTKIFPWGKWWTQITKVADTNGDKSWNHEVSCQDVCDKVCDKSATNPFVLL